MVYKHAFYYLDGSDMYIKLNKVLYIEKCNIRYGTKTDEN